MEQENQKDKGISSYDASGFAKARIGKTVAIRGDLLEGSDWRGPLAQIGTIDFQGSKATVHFATWNAAIQLPNTSEVREIRARCQSIESGPLPLCRLLRAGGSAVGDREVNVEFIFAAEQHHLPSRPYFRIQESVAASAKWIGNPNEFSEQLLKSLSVRTGKGWVLFCRFSGMLGETSDNSNNVIELINSNGDTVVCHIGYGLASGWIDVVGYEPRPRQTQSDGKQTSFWKESKIRIFGFDEAPILDIKQAGGALAPLEAMQHKRSTFLGCWKRYRELLNQMGQTLYEQRKQQVLTFRAGTIDEKDPSCHRVHIANWHEARAYWGEIKDVPVFVAKDQNGLVEDAKRSDATLFHVSHEGDARIRWKVATPHDNGVIMIAKYSAANDRRVVEAIGRLEKGSSAYPDLMSVLNDPTAALEPKKLTINPKGGIPYDESQSEAITKALGNRSIIAIQGPPGTGKTRVIVGIIKELYRKKRSGNSLAETAPFRVLISSAQNVAVFNAVDLLANEGILIDQRLSATARNEQENASRVEGLQEGGNQIAHRIEERIDRVPQLKFQVESSNAATRILRDISEITHSSNVHESLTEAFVRWLSSSPPENLYLLLERHAKRLRDLVIPPKGSNESGGSVQQIVAFLGRVQSSEQMQDLAHEISNMESVFDSAGLSHVHEVMGIEFRNLARATRDQKADAVKSIASEIKSLSARALEDITVIDSLEEQSPNQENQKAAELCLNALANELEDYRRIVTKQVGGVLSEWSNALMEEPGLWKRLIEKYAEIRGATCQMASPQASFDGIDVSQQYDLVVIDEAARTDPGELLIPLTLGKVLLLVGDQKQLPPYIDELAANKLQRDDPSGLELLREQSYFHELFEALPESNKTMLNRQYRCHPMIGRAISSAFYDGRLHSGPSMPTSFASWAAGKIPIWNVFDNHPLCWLNTDRLYLGEPCTNCNPIESELAVEIIGKVIATSQDENKQIGVISFYREQLKHIQARLEQAIPNYKRLIELDTVDSFQGKEFPFVILLTSRCDPVSGNVGFLALPNRVNVAVSRSQRQLVIIGSRSTLLHKTKGSQPFKDFANAAGEDIRFIDP